MKIKIKEAIISRFSGLHQKANTIKRKKYINWNFSFCKEKNKQKKIVTKNMMNES